MPASEIKKINGTNPDTDKLTPDTDQWTGWTAEKYQMPAMEVTVLFIYYFFLPDIKKRKAVIKLKILKTYKTAI